VTVPPSLRDAPDGGVFFLYGPERFLKEEVIKELVDRYVDPATRDFNLDVLRGSEVNVESLASVLATPPMMAEFRVVVVREVEALAGSPKAREVLTELMAGPPPGLVVLLEATIPNASKAKFYRNLQRGCRAAEFPAISADDVPGWIMARARDHLQREVEPEAARALGSVVGASLGILARELEKLAEMAGEGAAITVTDVETAGTHLPSQDRWLWFDLVGEKRFLEAREGLGILLAQGENAVSLTIGLATHFLRLGVLATGGSHTLEQLLPPHQKWLARRLQGQAGRWSVAEIDEAVLCLRRTDQLLKSSPMSQSHILEEWLLGVVVRAREAA